MFFVRGVGINRIRLEFKAVYIHPQIIVYVVLIESDWNLKIISFHSLRIK